MPRTKNGDQLKQALYDALPTSGEITYSTFAEEQRAIGNGDMLQFWQQLKHEGKISVRTVVNPDTGKAETYMSRI